MPFKPKHFHTVLIILSAFVFSSVSAQNQTNNYGKEFRFAFLENYGNFEKVSFVVSLTKLPTEIKIKCGSYNGLDTIWTTKDTIFNFIKFGTPSASNFAPSRSILITADNPVGIYAMNNALNSSDISAITPTERIPGNPEYFINTYRGDESTGKANNSLFSVVALDDSCMINIMPTADSKNNLLKNSLYKVLLRKGQVYQERAMDSQSFAGTRIWNTLGCKKFAVFEGAMCSYVEYANTTCAGCDHLYNQARPLQYLGTKFTTLPYEDMSGGYLYQVVATENNTSISINGVPVTSLNQGGAYTVNQTSNVPVCISSDKPVSVIELMKSGGCNGHIDNLGNPSLMSIIPDEQTTTEVGFSFPSTSNISQNPSFPADFYVGIVCPAGNLSSIKLNGISIDTAIFTRSCNVAVGSIKLNPALAYQVTSKLGFIAYMYAYGKDESYATEIGASFENKTTELRIDPNQTTVCDTFQEFNFTAISDSLASFKWDFGDGTFNTGDSVSKAYNKTGKFNLVLSVTYPSNKGCKEDTIKKLMTINNRPYFSLGNDTNLCKGVFFLISPVAKPKTTFRWNDNSSTSAYTVSNDKTVWLTLTDTNQCTYTDSLLVRFMNCDTNSIQIPNVFTPGNVKNGVNPDDFNDLFETRFTGFDQLKGQIFNRWGVVVYTFNYPQDSYWNGSVNNDSDKPCPPGTYYYLFEYVNTSTNLTKTYNGVVQLIR